MWYVTLDRVIMALNCKLVLRRSGSNFKSIRVSVPTQTLCAGKILYYHDYSPCATKLLGGILLSLHPSVCPSIRPASCMCLLCSTYSSGWLHFIFIHLIKQLQEVCCVWSFLQNFKIWIFGNFLEIFSFDFVLLWLEIWCESLVRVIMAQAF